MTRVELFLQGYRQKTAEESDKPSLAGDIGIGAAGVAGMAPALVVDQILTRGLGSTKVTPESGRLARLVSAIDHAPGKYFDNVPRSVNTATHAGILGAPLGLASYIIWKRHQNKEASASPVLDTIGQTAYSATVPPIGELTKYIRPDDVDKSQKSLQEGNEAAALVPFYNSYRAGKAQSVLNARLQRDYGDKSPRGQMLAEDVGAIVGATAPAALGFAHKGFGGAYAGAALSAGTILLATVAAMVKKRRTFEEQAAHDNKATGASDLLVPGVGVYNKLKRLGTSRTLTDKGEK